ncbi:MAG: endonuclease MutS2, partial [Thermodesulfovibrionales bacterium]
MISSKTLQLLEFWKVLEYVTGFSNSDASRYKILSIRPLDSVESITSKLSLVQELMRLCQEGAPLRLSHFDDVSSLLKALAPEGSVLEPLELRCFVPLLHNSAEIASQVGQRRDCPHLGSLARQLGGLPDILDLIEGSIDPEGNIRDDASLHLAELRADIRKREARIRRRLDDMVRDERLSVFLQDDFITKRSGRWVIPVRMDSKGQVAGVVHDVSRSGETAYVEPLSIISLSNDLENLVAEQKAEELRILRRISARMRSSLTDLGIQFETVVTVDTMNAVCLFADEHGMMVPSIIQEGPLRIVRGRHPLLVVAYQTEGADRAVVPIDAELGGDATVMVITGPNAGGKTIAIKTIGILALMALSGMPIPADSSSVIPVFGNILADIGDEQSIEHHLSTFSARVAHVAEILENSRPNTLVLIDELGTGTDPDEGAALACSVLQEIQRRGALAFATTHLTGIKVFVGRAPRMLNASMNFDHRTLSPLFTLSVGEPGQSNALDVAGRFGIPSAVVDNARRLLGALKVELDLLHKELRDKKIQCERTLTELEAQRSVLLDRERELATAGVEADRQCKESLARAYEEAAEIIRSTKRRMHELLDAARRAEKRELRARTKLLEKEQAEAVCKAREFREAPAEMRESIREGDMVFISSLDIAAKVLRLDSGEGRLRVRARGAEIDVPLED